MMKHIGVAAVVAVSLGMAGSALAQQQPEMGLAVRLQDPSGYPFGTALRPLNVYVTNQATSSSSGTTSSAVTQSTGAAANAPWSFELSNGTAFNSASAPLFSSITNFPTTQAVTGAFYQATQPVSGTFFQATQPVSLTSLPALAAGSAAIGSVIVSSIPNIVVSSSALPTGASTSANQTTQITAEQAIQASVAGTLKTAPASFAPSACAATSVGTTATKIIDTVASGVPRNGGALQLPSSAAVPVVFSWLAGTGLTATTAGAFVLYPGGTVSFSGAPNTALYAIVQSGSAAMTVGCMTE